MNKKALIVTITALIALMATPVTAREGLYLGAYYPITTLSGDILGQAPTLAGLDSGTGLGGKIGLGFGRYVGIEGSLFQTSHDAGINPTADFSGGTVDLKIYFPLTGSQIEPYLLAGVGKYQIENALVTYRGEGYEYGIGASLYLFPELSVNAGYTKRNITFDSGSPFGMDVDGKARTFDVGVTYHFL
jgi:opacity protein-like surface antigen